MTFETDSKYLLLYSIHEELLIHEYCYSIERPPKPGIDAFCTLVAFHTT